MSNAMMTLRTALLAIAVVLAPAAIAADESGWRVGKMSGEVWFTSRDVQDVALVKDAELSTGDTVRTGPDGRVLLTRGTESILVSPNTTISLSKDGRRSMTTVLQQAGSILLDVEKRNHRHFEIATPHLAAVVKGTRFSVIVDNAGSRVGVREGQVEVTDFATGQQALLRQDQQASVAPGRASGLVLGGSGRLSPIRKGSPRSSPVRVAPSSDAGRAGGPEGLRASLPAGPSGATSRVGAVSGGASGTSGESVAAAQGTFGGSPASARSASERKSERTTERTITQIAFGWSGLGKGAPKLDRDDIAMAAVPGLVGVSVAIGVTFARWRRRRNEKKQSQKKVDQSKVGK